MIWPADVQKALAHLASQITFLFVELKGNIIFNLIVRNSSYIHNISHKVYLERYQNYLHFIFLDIIRNDPGCLLSLGYTISQRKLSCHEYAYHARLSTLQMNVHIRSVAYADIYDILEIQPVYFIGFEKQITTCTPICMI